MGDEIIRRRVVVAGSVQGVGFRAHVVRHASALDLAGSVRNAPDGTVECIVEGPPHRVRAFLDEVRVGPRLARIRQVDVVDEPPEGLTRPFHVAG